MASYRYERDIDPKDLKPRKQRQYSRKERWTNWWDYNLKWVLIFGIAGAFVAYCFIGQYFLTTHPDYNIAVVSPYYLPEATVTALQQQLAAYGEDCNGDGKVVVKLNQYTMAFNSEDSDAYLDMAGTTKLSTDIQSSLSSIFILYDPAGFQQTTGTLRYLDGHLPKSDADSDWWNMVYRWTDCPVLTGMELGSYTSDAVQSASGDSQQLLADYYIGRMAEGIRFPAGKQRAPLGKPDRRGCLHRRGGALKMRFRIKAGGAAVHITFDRTPKPQPPAPPSPRAADLDNPYGRYYGKARSWEDILKNK